MSVADDIERAAELYFRVREFHEWVRTNVLFPMVPDTIVHPLRELLRDAELKLVAVLYDRDEIERVAVIQKRLERAQ